MTIEDARKVAAVCTRILWRDGMSRKLDMCEYLRSEFPEFRWAVENNVIVIIEEQPREMVA